MLTQTVAGRVYDYSHAVGRQSMGNPVGVALGSDNTVYALSRGSESVPDVPWNRTGSGAKVGKYTIGTTPGDEEFVADFSRSGDDDGELIWPAGINVDGEDRVYVTDEWLNRVSIFDSDGNFLNLWGSSGAGDGEFSGPSGIAIDPQDILYVVDSRNHRVQKLTKDGGFLGKWGSFGAGEGEFNSPWGITLDQEGYVYVADHKNHRAQKFSPDGEYVAEFGNYGTGRGQLSHPSGVAVDPDGDVYVCDWANNRVQVFGPDGIFVTSLIGDAQQLSKWQQERVDANMDVIKARRRTYSLEPEWRFDFPTAVVFDAENWRLFVTEPTRWRFQIYNKLKDYLEPQFNL